jgi:hypothetical protein
MDASGQLLAACPIEEITTCKHVCGLLCTCGGGRCGERRGRRDFAVVPDWVYRMPPADEVCATLGQGAVRSHPPGLPLDGGSLVDTWLRTDKICSLGL